MLGKYSYIKIVLISLMTFFYAACGDNKKDIHAGHEEVVEPVYTCPMHPEIIRNAPGSCPICGMDLVRKEDKAQAIRDLQLDDLLKPTNEFAISTISMVTMEPREEIPELNVLGTVTYDTRQIGTISSRVSGRIERLYLRYKYQEVRKGQRVMEIYSPELLTAQQNLLFLLKNDPDNNTLINAAKNRLLLLGMNNSQIRQVINSGKPVYSVSVFSNYSGFVTDFKTTIPGTPEPMVETPSANQELSLKEGMYLQAGQSAFTVYNNDRAWILLNIFPEQQSIIKVGDPVKIIPETAPQQSFRAVIDYIEPVFRPESKTIAARVYFNNASLKLPIGSRVTATIFGSARKGNWLPKNAIHSLGIQKIVFVKEAGGFRAKKIETGAELNDYTQVLSGLTSMDSVAMNAHYLFDNEAFIKVK